MHNGWAVLLGINPSMTFHTASPHLLHVSGAGDPKSETRAMILVLLFVFFVTYCFCDARVSEKIRLSNKSL